jgi:tRNA(adenine34) deaminase
MCAGALVNARGAAAGVRLRQPEGGRGRDALPDRDRPRLNHRMAVTSGSCADECAALLRAFFEATAAVER